MKILKSREEKGYGVNLYLVEENEKVKVKASKREACGERVLSAPLDVHIAITNKCNMKCLYCYANDSKFMKQKDMTLQQLISVVDKCFDANVFKISWSGGEPLYRHDIFDILKYTSEKGFKQSIITNGMLITNEVAKKLKELDISVQISLHEITDEIFWDKCEVLKNNDIDMVLDVVMDEKLRGNVGSLIERCHDIGIKNIKFGPIIPIGAARNKIDLEKYKHDIIELLKEIEKYREDKIRIVTQFDNRRYRKELQILGLRELLCEGATTLLYIDNNGDVYPCPLLKEYKRFFAGNILEEEIDDIWQGEIMQNYRKIDIDTTGCHGCGQICGVWCRGLTYAYTGDINAHSPFCEYTRERAVKE